MGFLTFALLLPEPSEARDSAEFPGFRLLVLGYMDGVLKTGFGCSMVVRRLYKEAFTLQGG
jgi:hypothetical protein